MNWPEGVEKPEAVERCFKWLSSACPEDGCAEEGGSCEFGSCEGIFEQAITACGQRIAELEREGEMSDALSELRIMADGWRNQSGNSGGLRYAADDLDEFIADHPGLVDRTIHCTECGVPGPEFPPRGWTGVWVPDEGEHFRCPTCAGKEKP